MSTQTWPFGLPDPVDVAGGEDGEDDGVGPGADELEPLAAGVGCWGGGVVAAGPAGVLPPGLGVLPPGLGDWLVPLPGAGLGPEPGLVLRPAAGPVTGLATGAPLGVGLMPPGQAAPPAGDFPRSADGPVG